MRKSCIKYTSKKRYTHDIHQGEDKRQSVDIKYTHEIQPQETKDTSSCAKLLRYAFPRPALDTKAASSLFLIVLTTPPPPASAGENTNTNTNTNTKKNRNTNKKSHSLIFSHCHYYTSSICPTWYETQLLKRKNYNNKKLLSGPQETPLCLQTDRTLGNSNACKLPQQELSQRLTKC